MVCSDEIRRNKIMDISPKTHSDVTLITDDLAWTVQRQFVRSYLRAKELSNSYAELFGFMRDDLRSDIDEIIVKAVDKKFKVIKKSGRGIRQISLRRR